MTATCAALHIARNLWISLAQRLGFELTTTGLVRPIRQAALMSSQSFPTGWGIRLLRCCMEAMVSVAGHGAASEGALLFASAASSGSSASEAPLSGYFVLAQQWPAGVCRGEDGCAAGRGAGGGWTLHG